MDPYVVKMKEENGVQMNNNVHYTMNLVVSANQSFGVKILQHVILMGQNAVKNKEENGVLI